jgi:hypothetical protein
MHSDPKTWDGLENRIPQLFFAADMEAHRNVIGKRRSLGYKECGVTAIMTGKLKCLQLHRLLSHNVPTERRPRFTEKTAARTESPTDIPETAIYTFT